MFLCILRCNEESKAYVVLDLNDFCLCYKNMFWWSLSSRYVSDKGFIMSQANRAPQRWQGRTPFSIFMLLFVFIGVHLQFGSRGILHMPISKHSCNNKHRSYLLSTTWSNFFQSLPFQSLFLLLDSSQVPIFYLQSSRCCFLLADFPPLAASLLVEFPSLFYIAESSSFFQLSLFFY